MVVAANWLHYVFFIGCRMITARRCKAMESFGTWVNFKLCSSISSAEVVPIVIVMHLFGFLAAALRVTSILVLERDGDCSLQLCSFVFRARVEGVQRLLLVTTRRRARQHSVLQLMVRRSRRKSFTFLAF